MKILLITLALLLVGCVSSGTHVQDSALKQFQKGVTTEADVVKALGAPQSTSTSMSGAHTISYVGLSAQSKAATFIPIVGLFAGGANAQTSIVTFTFDTNGKLSDIQSQQSNAESRMGLGVTPNVSQ
jgi:outer membrane protein assembly factor BamE (lipoprotein component of BamABCDE complex)